MALLAIALIAGCTGKDDRNWQGGLRLEIEWDHYKDVNPVCHREMAQQKIEVLPTFHIDDCKRLDGKRCYIFTDAKSPEDDFGFLVHQCFDERKAIIDYEKDG